jgi:hypothetical protein
MKQKQIKSKATSGASDPSSVPPTQNAMTHAPVIGRELGTPIPVPFNQLFLDPNNPRIAPDDRPGYEKPEEIASSERQSQLAEAVKADKEISSLVRSIVDQGWAPIDAVLVWRHHKKPDIHIVVEGNRRTVALRELRELFPKEQKKLQRMEDNPSKYTQAELKDQRSIVERMHTIVQDTDTLYVVPVLAKTPEELEVKLPRILGVRHVTHAQEWKPYAQSAYLLEQYQSKFRRKYGSDKDLEIDRALVAEVGALVSLKPAEAKKQIRSASAFKHLVRDYTEKLTPGDRFKPEDHYYVSDMLENRFTTEQFDFAGDQLYLDPEKEEVLFQWCFKYPRGSQHNVFRKAEDFRLWAKIKRYDDDKATRFASELDVSKPDTATKLDTLEAKYLAHKAQVSPVDTIDALLDQLRNLKAETLLTQASHLRPMLVAVSGLAKSYVDMIDAEAQGKKGTGH